MQKNLDKVITRGLALSAANVLLNTVSESDIRELSELLDNETSVCKIKPFNLVDLPTCAGYAGDIFSLWKEMKLSNVDGAVQRGKKLARLFRCLSEKYDMLSSCITSESALCSLIRVLYLEESKLACVSPHIYKVIIAVRTFIGNFFFYDMLLTFDTIGQTPSALLLEYILSQADFCISDAWASPMLFGGL